jgi:multiple sugar transport system substrate-binding protein
MTKLQRVFVLLVVCSLLIMLAACAAPGPAQETGITAADSTAASTTDGAQIELRVSWWGNQERHDRTIAAIELYEQLNPHVDITYEFSGFADYWTLMTTQATGGNLPDVMQMSYAYITEWTSRGLLLPLDPYIDSDVLNTAYIADATLQTGIVNDQQIGIALGVSPDAWVLDLDAFEEAGVELPAQDWTWADLERIALELHEALGIWGAGTDLIEYQVWEAVHVGAGEGGIYGAEGEFTWTDQPTIDHLNMVLRLQEAGAIPARAEAVEIEASGISTLIDGRAAMDASLGSNLLVGMWENAGADRRFALIHIPRSEGGAPSVFIKPSMYWSIPANTEHPEEAARFIDWFVNSIEANEILLAERGVPVNSIVRESLAPSMVQAQQEIFAYVGRVEADGSPMPPLAPAGQGDVRNNLYLQEMIDPVLYGMISPEEAVAQFRAQAAAVIEAAR